MTEKKPWLSRFQGQWQVHQFHFFLILHNFQLTNSVYLPFSKYPLCTEGKITWKCISYLSSVSSLWWRPQGCWHHHTQDITSFPTHQDNQSVLFTSWNTEANSPPLSLPSSTPFLTPHSLFSWPGSPFSASVSPTTNISFQKPHSQSPRGPNTLSVGTLLFPIRQTLKYRRKVVTGRTENSIPLAMIIGLNQTNENYP